MKLELPEMSFGYTNWKGSYRRRRVTLPIHVHFGVTPFHPEPCWLMHAFDLDKQDFRDFDMSKMVNLAHH